MSGIHLKDLSKVYRDQIAEKKDDSYLETDMKKRQKNNEKARKDMKKMGSMSNPHFGDGQQVMSSEEVEVTMKHVFSSNRSQRERHRGTDRNGHFSAGQDWVMTTVLDIMLLRRGSKQKLIRFVGKKTQKDGRT